MELPFSIFPRKLCLKKKNCRVGDNSCSLFSTTLGKLEIDLFAVVSIGLVTKDMYVEY